MKSIMLFLHHSQRADLYTFLGRSFIDSKIMEMYLERLYRLQVSKQIHEVLQQTLR